MYYCTKLAAQPWLKMRFELDSARRPAVPARARQSRICHEQHQRSRRYTTAKGLITQRTTV